MTGDPEYIARRKESEERERRREKLAALPWEWPDAATGGVDGRVEVEAGVVTPWPRALRVRFIHVADEFELSESDPNFDIELWALPAVGHRVDFPGWFYDYGCVVTEVHWMLGDESPADVIVTVES